MTRALSQLAPKWGFKIMTITIFIFMVAQINPGNPPDPWNHHCPWSTLKSSFKTMTINIYILMLTRINPNWPFWPRFWLKSTPKSRLKTIIIIFIFILTRVKLSLSFDVWHRPCRESIFKLSFKAIIIIFIFTYFIWIILKLRVLSANICFLYTLYIWSTKIHSEIILKINLFIFYILYFCCFN